MDYEVERVRIRGRPKKTWSDVVKKDCQTWRLCMLWGLIYKKILEKT